MRPSNRFGWLIWGFICALFLFGCGGATKKADTPPPEADAGQADDRSAAIPKPKAFAFAWRVEAPAPTDKGLTLLGSIHVGNDNFYPLDPVIEKTYASSEALIVEVNLAAVPHKKMVKIVYSKAELPPNQTLESRLSKDTWAKLIAALNQYNVPVATVYKFKPWFAALTVAMLRIVEAGYSPAMGVDQYFIKRGNKEIIELETADFQLSLFDELSLELQELLLLDAIEGSLQAGGDLERVLNAWKTGDADALRKAMFGGLTAQPEFQPLYEKMIAERNVSMVKRIEALLETKNNLFVVVGAGHLVGTDGLLAIFEKKGYIVKQLEKQSVSPSTDPVEESKSHELPHSSQPSAEAY